MAEPIQCINQFNQMLQRVDQGIDPANFLKNNFLELLKERVIVDTEGKEINGRLTELLARATADARENQRTDLQEPLARAIVRNALRRLKYSCDQTLGGLPTGPAYERSMPDTVTPAQFGHEKVGYPMSDYPRLGFLPVGGLGAPLCEIDYSTCYLREGFMVQDAPIRQMNVTITSPGAPPVRANLNGAEGTYSALYPLSERTYDLPIPFSITQYSPVIPGNYRSSSLPVEIIELNAENPTDKQVTVTFTLNQENLLGWYPKKGKEDPKNPHGRLVWDRQSRGNYAESFQNDNVVGLLFQKEGETRQQVRVGTGFAGQIAIASPSSESAIVNASAQNKSLTITLTLQPGERVTHPITVAYDLPFYNFQYDPTNPASPGARMPKFYTRFYDETGQNARRIALDALRDRAQWREEIANFQNTITGDPALPDFFKQALLNELYVLPETGIWEATEGRFAYLESIDYKMYNTSDVNSYTWALLTLFPELEKNDLLELARLTPLSDPTHRWYGTDRWANIPPAEWKHLYWSPVKDNGAVCHDLGGLLGEGIFPFKNTCNEFNWSNANMWIDLAPKFALRVQRYLSFMAQQKATSGIRAEDASFLATVFPAVKLALDTLERRWGESSTHIPISKGIPDWTYDTISGHGYTPNVVTQWLAALQAAQNMATLSGDNDTATRYATWYMAGSPVLDRLWNEDGGYYNAFFAPESAKTNSNIHSDMFFGDFYASMTGLPASVSDERMSRSLRTIYRVNGEEWASVGNHGPLGLVNLRGPNSEPNRTEQGDEGWTGTMLLNAAHQIRLGQQTNNQDLVRNGWNIVHGFYNVVYSSSPDSQHWVFRTPEGYVNPSDMRYNDTSRPYGNETGRAPKYMRALAIWAVYAALKDNQMPVNIYENKIANVRDAFPISFEGREPVCRSY